MLASTQTTLSAELSFVQAGGLDFGWRKSSSEEAGKGLLITAANTEGWGWGCEWTMPVQGGRQEGAAGVIPNTGLAGNDQDPPPPSMIKTLRFYGREFQKSKCTVTLAV